MKQKYKRLRFSAESQEQIDHAVEILQEYIDAGLRVTVRQLYYQFVARDLIPNNVKSYKSLAATLSRARLAGLLDWDAIEDRGRVPNLPSQWSSITRLVEIAVEQFRLPRHRGQYNYVELHCEKQALESVLEPVALELHVPLVINKGYSSQSAMRETAQRFRRAMRDGHSRGILFYLGDLDPSGEQMVEDIRTRLGMFEVNRLEVRKIALTPAQVGRYKPPPNPAKKRDPRYKKYAAEHGTESWEVDALDPRTLQRIIRADLEAALDLPTIEKVIEEEESQRERLRDALAWMKDRQEDAAMRGSSDESDEPEGDEPESDEPESDEPEGDEPESDEPEGDEPEGDEPEGDEPESDEPEGDEPESDEPEGDD